MDAIGGDLRATPLQWAARNGHLYILHLLMRHSADPNIRDTQGFNTLHLVTHSSVVMALLYVLQQPLAVDEKDSDGHTALMWAAWQGDAISVDLLIRHGASVHATDNAQLTPLHWAAVKGSRACIKRLLEAGADVSAEEENGKTARTMAEELKALEPYRSALEEHGLDLYGNKSRTWLSPVSAGSFQSGRSILRISLLAANDALHRPGRTNNIPILDLLCNKRLANLLGHSDGHRAFLWHASCGHTNNRTGMLR